MKQFFLSLVALCAFALASTESYTQSQSIGITAFDCNPEAIREKATIEHCIEIIAENLGWSDISHMYITHTSNGLVITFYTDNGSAMIHCLNDKSMVLIDIIKIKGNSSYLALKDKIKSALQATKLKIALNNRG